jgi:hypothetical protein
MNGDLILRCNVAMADQSPVLNDGLTVNSITDKKMTENEKKVPSVTDKMIYKLPSGIMQDR